MFRHALGFLLQFLLAADLYAAAILQTIEVKQQAGKVSLYFKLNQSVPHRAFTLTNPDRIVVDFEHTQLGFDLKKVTNANHLITVVRSGHPTPNSLRLVFEVSNTVRVNPLSAQQAHLTSRDVAYNVWSSHFPATAPIKVTNNQRITPLVKKATQSPVMVHTAPRGPLRDVVVVIDPGHGGKDPGAMGPNKAKEKEITLAIARQLKQIIDRQPGMRAVLTRSGDYYVGLRDRLNIARRDEADVFVSIHADAFNRPDSSGASVFALSQRGATSEAARWLAEKENYSELGGVNLKALDDNSGLVRTVLIDLSQTATISASLKMGERVLRQLNTMTRLHDRQVDQARFMVLKSPDIPSVLVETGFISNPREAKNLTDSRYQTRLSQAIFQGVKAYFWDYPPHGSRIEAMTGNNLYHLVKPGESLSQIANHYHVSMAELAIKNHLSNNVVKLGQRLQLPS